MFQRKCFRCTATCAPSVTIRRNVLNTWPVKSGCADCWDWTIGQCSIRSAWTAQSPATRKVPVRQRRGAQHGNGGRRWMRRWNARRTQTEKRNPTDRPWGEVIRGSKRASIACAVAYCNRQWLPPMPPLSLSDDELTAIMTACQPLAPDRRVAFLEDVARALATYPVIGPGHVHRAIVTAQRAH